MLEAKSLKKAVVPSTLIQDPSPGSLQSTRLALHVSEDPRFCFVYIASGCDIFKLQITLEESSVCKGKEGLLIPEQTEDLVVGANKERDGWNEALYNTAKRKRSENISTFYG